MIMVGWLVLQLQFDNILLKHMFLQLPKTTFQDLGTFAGDTLDWCLYFFQVRMPGGKDLCFMTWSFMIWGHAPFLELQVWWKSLWMVVLDTKITMLWTLVIDCIAQDVSEALVISYYIRSGQNQIMSILDRFFFVPFTGRLLLS